MKSNLNWIVLILGFSFITVNSSFNTPMVEKKEMGLELVTSGNLTYPKELEAPILRAFSHYEELEQSDIHINFIYKDEIAKSVMQAQPYISSFLKDKSKREYKINVSRYVALNGEEYALAKFPEEILVGWFAHELGHIQDYFDRSNVGMFWFGLRYISSEDFLKQAEWRADMNAVDAGFSEELVLMKNYINPAQGFDSIYCDRINTLYPSCEDINAYFHESESSASGDDD